MKKLLFTSVFYTQLILFSFAQESVNDKAISVIDSDFFHKSKIEKFSLHTNKTLYFAGEKIWFKAYIVEDDNNLPFTESTNIYLNLYDADLKLVDSNLFYSENGKTFGEIQLSKDLTSGFYYLQLDSQWNNNFNRKSIYTIQIVNLSNPGSVNINAKSYAHKTKLTQNENNLDGFEIFRTDSNNDNEVAFEISPKTNIISNLHNRHVFAILHREGSVRSMASILFNENKEIYIITFNKKDLFNGLYTISVFNDKKEELYSKNFFNYNENSIKLNVNTADITLDSLTLNLNVFGSKKTTNISISVLPQETMMFKNQSNILSDLLLKPYIKNDNYNTANRVKDYNQDDFDVITQLATKENVFAHNKLNDNKNVYSSESGIELNGNVSSKSKNLSKYKVMLSSLQNNIKAFSDIDNDNNFSFKKILLYHPSEYSLSLLNKKGEIIAANFFIYNTYTKYKVKNTLDIKNEIKQIFNNEENIINSTTIDNTALDNNFPKFKEIKELDEVMLEATRFEKEKKLKKRAKLDGVFGVNFARLFQPEDSGFGKSLLLMYLQTLPRSSVLYINKDGFTTPVLNNDGPTRSINDPPIKPIAVILDNVLLDDLSILEFIQTEDIDYVSLNLQGAGYGSLYPYGVLHIASKKGNDSKPKSKINYNIKKFSTAYGFIKPLKKYKLPEFQFSSQKASNNFGTIDWVPNFNIEPNVDNYLKVNRKDFDSVKLIINGITEDGKPIYKEQIINLSSN